MLHTPVHIPSPPYTTSNEEAYLALGSCFANTIGKKLETYKFDIAVNPFGVIFNPLSLLQLIDFSINNAFPYNDRSLYGVNQDIHFHHLVHSDLSSLNYNELNNNIEQALAKTSTQFQKAETILLTFGTAIVYETHEGKIVANCHKKPAQQFKKRFLSTKEILDIYEKVAPFLATKRIILTVSPVRHAKEGMIDNSTSKSILKYTCHTLQQQYKNVYYFPAYEILLDELRDYRFFAEDMLHPSSLAQEIIWEKFRDSVFDEKTIKEIFELEKIMKSFHHKPFLEKSNGNISFMKHLLDKLKTFNGNADLSYEIQILEERLNKFS